MKSFEKASNHHSRGVKCVEQSFSDSTYEIPAKTLIAPRHSVENFKLCRYFFILFQVFGNYFSKDWKISSWKLNAFERPQFEARIATLGVPRHILTSGLEISTSVKFCRSKFSENFWKIILKTPYLGNLKGLSIQTWWHVLQCLRVTWQRLSIKIRVSNFLNFLNLIFMKDFEKIIRNVITRLLQEFLQSYMKARFSNPENTLITPTTGLEISISKTSTKVLKFSENSKMIWVLQLEAKFADPGENWKHPTIDLLISKLVKQTLSDWKSKKKLSHYNIRYSLNLKNLFL